MGGFAVTYTVELPNGDIAVCESFDAAKLAAETLIEDQLRFMRDNLVVKKDGKFDAHATEMLQQDGMLV